MRKIRIASASFLMEDSPHTVEFNLERGLRYVRDAKSAGADIICLPETFATNGVPDASSHIQDHSRLFSSWARENAIALIAPCFVRDGNAAFNQANVFSSDGSLAGYYRKAQPTGVEARWVTPGDNFPIIDLGFAKIAVMICMDIYFPEIARIYAMKGAEILFWPTVTHGPTQSGLEAQIKSRAVDNSLYIVESNLSGHPPYAPYKGRFYPGNARVIDFNGDVIAQTGRRAGLAIADIDLDEWRTTTDVFLITDLDDTRADLESLARLDLYAKEYAALAAQQHRYYDTLKRPQ